MTSTSVENPTASAIALHFRAAQPHDGAHLWRLARATGTLEVNSAYFYLLFASDFADTCLVAEHEGQVVGMVIGYRPPTDPRAAFVWQIGLLPEYQGLGLGPQLLDHWFELPAFSACAFVTATVADDNPASQSLFRRFARAHGVACEETSRFTVDMFPHEHPSEPQFRIGPIRRGVSPRA
ncbi:MAG: diaminobutyrate acetyltransferase [Hydrogenophaga sp.]|jgi:L-2,4-diaminobutyric acid acetyltransferase|uniref:diaminobutyrate acetyltransferase n=1 Tax=Hydrogenophaga sp. TaxID=1904254 RepID=UPI0026075108|nr:diaminobutyrate acetyltransferase [Hydrogenophaga sp.]MCV0440943.1 diaminobutyrate acetyltransferase [Hydrogenophaga sp.]